MEAKYAALLETKGKNPAPNLFLPQLQKLLHSNLLAEGLALEKTEELSANPVDFCREILGFKPYAYQEEFIKLFVEN
jgi:hypothetical protein